MINDQFAGNKYQLVSWALLLLILGTSGQRAPAQFMRDFAALEGFVKQVEQPYRQDICLNGSWQFQPVAVPAGYQRDQGVPPELPFPTDSWEATRIKIPSPWNVNTWGCGRNVGAGTSHPYWPDSVYFPSYPPYWDEVQMGWLRRNFLVPSIWKDKRVLLHFEAVAGDCQVFVNNKPAGGHFENFLPFDLDITDLIQRGMDNELLVGVRQPHLYDKTNAAYPHERRTYADGSYLDGIVGIWQDVYLLGVPAVRVTDAFVQPWVDHDELVVTTTLRNDTHQSQEVTLEGAVSPWVNEAGPDVLSAAEPKWRLGRSVLRLPGRKVQIPAETNVVITLEVAVKGSLSLWSPDTPNLFGLVLNVVDGTRNIDTHYQRFGWRQFQIRANELLLNGRKFQIFADILHPFGVSILSRRTAWAWFKMIKEAGGNGVRLHAQPWPSYYQDLADEMGLVVLAEDGLFGSSLMLNFTDPSSWPRFTEHYEAMILRDRNHPSVFGWSFGNELFAIFDYNHMGMQDRDKYYAKLTELGRCSFKLDPTRDWISCDGDEDLRGTMPVWSKHFGHGLHLDSLPANLDKPLMIGESGGTYYATPSQLAEFNGERAYESYAGRNEALAIDVYQNIVQMARHKLAYFSASELVWFGLEHLPLGYSDFTRLPRLNDGIFFKPFEEGKAGIQPERIPPYVTTLNPGLDSSLPIYKPLAMFDAVKAALAKNAPQPSPWDHVPKTFSRPNATNVEAITSVDFVGDRTGTLFSALSNLGVPLCADAADSNSTLLVIDGETLTVAAADEIKPLLDALLARGGQALICLRQPKAHVEPMNRLLPVPVSLTAREATALERGDEHLWNATFSLANLYFAENAQDKQILKCGLDGPFVRHGTIIFRASNTDWSQFNNVGEAAKCSAVELYEQLAKPFGAALVTMKQGRGFISISTIDYAPEEAAYVKFWQTLFHNMGVKMGEAHNAWLLPTAFVQPVSWRYTTNAPAIGWEKHSFDDSGWNSGDAGFGTEVPNIRARTLWTTGDIWLRNTFSIHRGRSNTLKLVVYHDEDVDVYINGKLVWAESGFITNYKEIQLPEEIIQKLTPTNNQIAIHCHQTTGGQYIDAGLAEGMVFADDGRKREHNLLLNGPKN
jgi:beta-galactosidase